MPLGRHFALSEADLNSVKELALTTALVEFISNDVEERYTEEWFGDTDKAWDAIHRAFNDSALDYRFETPLQGVILGGEPLYGGDDYVVSLKTADEVRKINDALQPITREDFEMAYRRIDPEQYGFPLSDDDLDYSWHWLGDLKSFYARAAAARRAVIFTTDQ